MRLLVLGLLGIVGCASTAARDAEMRRYLDQQQAAREEDERRQARCEQAERDPKAPEDYVRACRAARWARSAVSCTDVRVSDRVVEVTCELRPTATAWDFVTRFEMAAELAAVSTLAAGRTHFVSYGGTQVSARRSDSTTPVTCSERVTAGNVVATALGAMAASRSGYAAGTARTRCDPSPLGGGFDCRTTLPTQVAPVYAPSPEYECRGGDTVSTVIGLVATERFELLTADEAAARNAPELPPDRRPWAARAVMRLLRGPAPSHGQGSVTEHPGSP